MNSYTRYLTSNLTARGVLERSTVAPRESIGVGDARRWIFGSEGAFGIVTRAVAKIFPVPEAQVYGSIVFPDFEKGVAFLYDLTRQETPPASVRLVDNLQFQLSQILKGRRRGLAACAENGERGYALTFGIAYIRDWIMNHWILAESVETSAPWSAILPLCENVKRRVREDHAARGLPGKPFISCRVTQVYHTGACVYFYFATYMKGVDDPARVYAEIERAARDEVLRSGGSLSHHHGIGKLRRRFLPRVLSSGALEWSRQLKASVDPTNVFGAGNQAFGNGESETPPPRGRGLRPT